MSGDIILKTRDLKKTFMQGKIPVHALRGVDIDIKRSELVSIVGPSGSGKSTMLSIIGMLEKPTQGKVFIDNIEVTKAKNKDIPKLRREKIGFVFQHFNLLSVLSALGNVEIAMRFARVPKKKRMTRAKEVLTEMGLGDRLKHKPSELSGGEQQRVSIARALANRPAIILADEPTGEVDTKTRELIINILRRLSDHGQTVIIVTHDPWVAERTDRTIKLVDGKIEDLLK
ncbi:MAG: ABC transporter ATP-binding protein [Methanosarcinales archaeon]|nr:ABC transporter ATP-binding protein [Methanosarcinales archaeon]